MTSVSSSEIKLCPFCGSILQRYPRNLFHRIIGVFILVKRYRCENKACRFTILRAPENKAINACLMFFQKNEYYLFIIQAIAICMLIIILWGVFEVISSLDIDTTTTTRQVLPIVQEIVR